jgi:hypothetical protein
MDSYFQDSPGSTPKSADMNPVVRVIGKMLRMVGVSSPEDNLPKPRTVQDPPSWRDQKMSKSDDSSQSSD